MTDKFQIQDTQYKFPYHHLINLKNQKTYNYLYWGLEYYGYVYFILNFIKNIKKDSIAEIGCGDGKISIEIAKRFKNSKIEGYDLSEQAILFAKSFGFNYNNLKFYNLDFSRSKKKYDLCLLIEVLEHIPEDNIDSFLKNIFDKLDNNGKLLISVPTKNIPLNKKHYRHYDLKLLQNQVSNYFKIITVNYIHNESKYSYKFIRSLLVNRFFILNSLFFKKLLYSYYLNNCLKADVNTGSHLIVLCQKNIYNE